MKTSRTFGAVSAVAAVLPFGGAAWAADETYRSNQTGNWNDYSTSGGVTWEVFRNEAWVDVEAEADLPGTGDTATILNGHTVTLSDARLIKSLTVNSGGQLVIDGANGAEASLKFSSAESSPALFVTPAAPNDGVKMVDYARIKVEQSMSFTTGGTGSIKAEDGATCYIEIGNPSSASTVTLTLDLLVHGEVQIVGVGTGSHTDALVNNVLIWADNSGAITLASSLESLTDLTGGVRWKVGGAGNSMVFNIVGATGLAGNFELLSRGQLVFTEDVTTAGTFKIECGIVNPEVDVDTATFTYSGGIASENCSNTPPAQDPPANAISTDYNCVCP